MEALATLIPICPLDLWTQVMLSPAVPIFILSFPTLPVCLCSQISFQKWQKWLWVKELAAFLWDKALKYGSPQHHPLPCILSPAACFCPLRACLLVVSMQELKCPLLRQPSPVVLVPLADWICLYPLSSVGLPSFPRCIIPQMKSNSNNTFHPTKKITPGSYSCVFTGLSPALYQKSCLPLVDTSSFPTLSVSS